MIKQRNCTVKGCINEGRYCRIHQQEEFAPIATTIKKESGSRKDQLKIYRVEARKFITQHKECKMNMEGCEKEARCVHHSKGRIGDLLLDKTYWIPSCYHCNLMVEIKDAEARQKGLKVSRLV